MRPNPKLTSAIFSLQRVLHLNRTLLCLTLLLSSIGIAMLYSAAGGEWDVWAQAHTMRLVTSSLAMVIVMSLSLRFWLNSAYYLYVAGLLLLVAVDIFGHVGMGAQRWISIGGVSLQPSEFMKIAVILALARYFHHLHPMDQGRPLWMLPPLLLIAAPVLLILRQPNLGTATIVSCIGLILWFASGLKRIYLISGAILAAIAVPLSWNFLHDYQKQRVLTFLNPEADPLGSGYNIMQSIIAIGSGGGTGRGFLQGSQSQLDFLPEKHTDFIFTMVAEEFGFIGSIGLLLLFTLLLGYGLAIAIRCRHRFGALVAVGITALLWLHVMINVAMVMGLIPVVGVPLPFLSYGGTILLSVFLAVGLLQNAYIDRDSRLR